MKTWLVMVSVDGKWEPLRMPYINNPPFGPHFTPLAAFASIHEADRWAMKTCKGKLVRIQPMRVTR